MVEALRAASKGTRFTPSSCFRKKFVGAVLDKRGGFAVGRSAVRRIVFETAILGRIVRGRDDDAVRQASFPAAVVVQNGVRNGGCGRVLTLGREHHGYGVGGQHFQRTGERRLGQRMRVDAEEKRPADPVLAPVLANGLRDREDVPLVEGHVERGAAMSRGSERYALRSDSRVRPLGKIRRNQSRDVYQIRRLRRLTGARTNGHERGPP